MLDLLWLVPALPLVGFVVLAFAGHRLPAKAAAAIGSGAVGLSAAAAAAVSAGFLFDPPAGGRFHQVIGRWLEVDGFSAGISFDFDALSMVMVLVVTFVGFLIHVYSAEYMAGDDGYSRFFAY